MKQILVITSILFATISLIAQSPSNLTYVELDSLLDSEYKQGHYEKALIYAELATDAAQNVEQNDSLYAICLYKTGNLHRDLSNMDEAEKALLKALAIQQKTLGKMHSDCANTQTTLVLIYTKSGKYDRAESYSLEALDILKKNKGKASIGYAVALNNLALLYYSIEKYEAAEVAYLEVLALFKVLVGDKHNAYAQVSTNLAIVYMDIQKYKEAESLFNQALAIYKENGSKGKEHPNALKVRSHLALLYDYTKEHKKSEALNLKILALRESLWGKEHPNYITSLNNLAELYTSMGEYAKAKPLQERVLMYNKKKYGVAHPDYLLSLNNSGLLHIHLKEYKKAEELFHELFEIKQNTQQSNHLNMAVELNNYALLYEKKGDFQKAIEYYKEALIANAKKETEIDLNNLSTVLSFDFYNNSNARISIRSLAIVYDCMYQKLGDQQYLEKKQDALDITIQLTKKIRASFGTDQDKLRALSKTSGLVETILENTVALLDAKNETNGYVEAAFSYAEENKSILLMDALKGQRAISIGDLPDSLRTKELSLQNAVAALRTEKAAATTEEENLLLQKRDMELTLDLNHFKQLLTNKYPKYNALKYENITASAKDIQQLLKQGEALIEYFVANDVLYAFFVNKKTIKLHSLAISKDLLHKKIKALRYGLTNYALIKMKPSVAYEAYTKPAYWFYAEIVAPVLEEAKDIKHLIVVADGELGNLPFEAFLTEQASQKRTPYNELNYLLNEFPISYNYSATLLKMSSELTQRTHNSQLLALAPTYENDSISSELRRSMHLEQLRKNLNPLPAAIEEIKGLERFMTGSFWYGAEANEANFKEKAGDYAILHLAMHGLLNSYTPILSSLAFTENGDSIEDNFLHAHEISKLKLNAELVVLSACETGYGEFEQGEGILSLARSFMYAGTPSLVVSLWPVNDGSTAIVMSIFYENLANGMTKSNALQQAKLAYLEHVDDLLCHPAFWSPFIQLGDSSPIHWATKKSWLPWSIGGGLLLIVGCLGLYNRKRNNVA